MCCFALALIGARFFHRAQVLPAQEHITEYEVAAGLTVFCVVAVPCRALGARACLITRTGRAREVDHEPAFPKNMPKAS